MDKKSTGRNLSIFGRGTKTRTLDTRFWRPLLYQLSYTPLFFVGSRYYNTPILICQGLFYPFLPLLLTNFVLYCIIFKSFDFFKRFYFVRRCLRAVFAFLRYEFSVTQTPALLLFMLYFTLIHYVYA